MRAASRTNSVGGFDGMQDFAPIEIPAWAGSLEQNAVKMPVDIRLLMLSVTHFAAWAQQYVEHIRHALRPAKRWNVQNKFALSLLMIFAFTFSLNAGAFEITKKAELLYGGVTQYFQTAQEAFDGVKAWLESGKAESLRIQGFYYEYIGQVPCNGKFFPQPYTINGVRADLLCNEWQQVNADGSRPYPPAIYDYIEISPVCPEPSSVWGYPQGKDLGNNSVLYYCTRYIGEREPAPEMCTGNPVMISSGRKVDAVTDYTSSSGLSFRRTYRSDTGDMLSLATASLSDATASSDGCYPGTLVLRRDSSGNPLQYASACFANISSTFSGGRLALQKPDGYVTNFTPTAAGATTVKAPANINETAVQLTDAQGIKTWKITREDDSLEIYSAGGLLQSKTTRTGQLTTFTYSDAATPATIAPRPNLMIAQTDPFGHTLQWRYNAGGQMVKMIDPALGEFDYTYDARGNMATVVYPPEATGARKTKTYHYEDATNGKLLTGITDENAFRYATYTYNTSGQVTETKHFAGPGVEVNKHTLAYPYQGRTTVTDPLGTARNYDYTNILNYDAVTGVSQPCASCGGSNAQAMTYDANRNITSRTDFNNNKTCYTYDLNRNLETARIEGLSSGADCAASFAAATLTAPARKTTTSWHPTYRLPASITEPITGGTKTTTHTYDASGNLTQRTVTTPQGSRTWTWSNYDAYGRAATMTDARGKITTYSYYPNTAAQNTTLANSRGMLASITNAVGHITTISAYNAHGQPLSMTDANGLATTMTYDARMRLKSRTVVGGGAGTGINETTAYDYDGIGQLVKVTLPDLSFISYTYDGAHRLVNIADTLNNSITYTLDNMGNRTGEAAKDPAGALARAHTREIDALNRVKKDIGATNPATQSSTFSYDNNGNQISVKDALGRVTDSEYDPLNRLVKVTDAATPTRGVTQYEYDAQDNLTQVTDAKGLATTYTYNGFNELLTQVSPDTGTTTFTYDDAGNLLTKTDARAVTATSTYDDLNRVKTVSYPAYQTDLAETVVYTYDTGCGGNVSSKGRLCSLTDKTGSTTYSYDLAGRITAKSQLIVGTGAATSTSTLTQSIAYRYNAAGQIDEMTLPSTKKVAYSYTNNRITGVTYDGTPIIKLGVYEPFGAVNEWTWGNHTTAIPNKYLRDYDLDGRIVRIDAGLVNGAIEPSVMIYNDVNQITSLQRLTSSTSSAVNATKSAAYGYDNLDRLTSVAPASGNPNPALSYAYDTIGNRLSATVGASVTNYSYATASHRLNSLSGADAKTYSYDATGNRITGGGQSWNYGGNNRPISVTAGTTTLGVRINALGQRVSKTVNGVITRFVYDEAGRLVGEYTDTGQPIQETIWFNDLPVAVIK